MHRARDLALAAAAALAAACGAADEGPPGEPPGLAAAEAALDAGRPGEALRGLRAIVAASLGTPEMRLRAARAAGRARDWALAARILERDAAAEPAGEAALLRIEGRIRSGDLDGAARALEAAGEPRGRGRVLRAMLAVARGRSAEAARDLEALARDGTGDPDAWILLAQCALPDLEEAQRRLFEGARACGDAAPIGIALGRLLLRAGEPARAMEHLAPAVRARPFDRDARLDLARARVSAGRDEDLDAAIADVRRIVADDPAEFASRLRLAETLAEKGVRVSRRHGDNPQAAAAEFDEALGIYEGLAAGSAPDAESALAVLLGQARVLVETIPLDEPARATAPGSRFRRAEAILERARALDPAGRLLDANGVLLRAEILYLRARASKRTHAGDRDHAESVGLYAQAVAADPRHLEASWDLALIEYDHLRTPEYLREAARHLDIHFAERKRRGLPDPDPGRMRIVRDIRRRAALGIGFPPGETTPE